MRLNPAYLRLIERYRRHALRSTQLLLEMNVSNLDEIKTNFTMMLDQAISDRGVPVPPGLRDLIVKRAVKAMGNDEVGNMTVRQPVEYAPENAPTWLRTALQNGDAVWHLDFKNGFTTRLAHVVDWVAADPQAARVIKAAPEADFLGHIGVAADKFFEQQSQQVAKQEAVNSETGRVVILTFRLDPATKRQIAYHEDDLTTDERGPVVAFWCRLDSASALNREGKEMQHCVGSYANMVETEEVVIYSLRDAQNNPHATVELNQQHGAPSINQVKGKNNKSPIGKYAAYIRDFLNEMGVVASHSGFDDLRGLGLLTHNGKYGTIMDVGGNIVHTFGNGDSLRYLDRPTQKYSYHDPPLTFMYVERDGTVPFQFEVNDKDKTTILSFRMLRNETSRFVTYEKNLIALFNQDHMITKDRDTFQQIGVFYDSIKKLWGNKDDLSEHLFDFKGFQVNRFGTDIWFFYDQVLTASFRMLHGMEVPHRVKIENDTPGLKLLPEAFEMFLNKYVYSDDFSMADLSTDQKDILYKFGIFPRKNGLGGVPDKQQIYTSKHGSIRHYMHRFYFYDKTGKLIGICYLGQTSRDAFRIPLDKVEAFGDSNKQAIFRLISAVTHDDNLDIRVEHGYSRNLVEQGFAVINNRLVPISEIEKEKTLKDGYSVVIQARDSGGRRLSLQQNGRKVAEATVDDTNRLESIWAINAGEERYYRQSAAGLEKVNTGIAAMLNASQVIMRRRDMLKYSITEKNGKFVPVTDPILLQFMHGGRIDLGKNFVFVGSENFTPVRNGEERRWEPQRFGRIEHKDQEYHTVVEVKFADGNKNELLYHMRRLGPDDHYTRDDIIKVSAHLMKLYHDKVEPFLSSQWVGSAPVPSDDD